MALGDGDLLVPEDRIMHTTVRMAATIPSSKPVEKHEEKKEKTPKEIEEDEEKTLKKQAEISRNGTARRPTPTRSPIRSNAQALTAGCDTGLADLIVNQIAVEQQNIVTDPLLTAWQDPHGNEATDECRDWFAPVLGGNVGAQEGSIRRHALQSGARRRRLLP